MAAGTTMFGVATPLQERPALTAEQREAVLNQLGRILSSPLFKHSKHYPAFLRFVVERALDGQEARLKERSIGIEVFSRDRDYDTNFDPVVRTSACEVRKRVAQYYQEPGHESELRIELHSGSYLPDFRFPAPAPAAVPEPVAAPVPQRPLAIVRTPREVPYSRWKLIAGLMATPLLLGLGAVTFRVPAAPLDRFWAPVWGSSDTIMLCMGEMRT